MLARNAVVAPCLATFACGGTEPVSPTPPPPGTFTVSGRVTDVDTGAPPAAATATILDGKDAGRGRHRPRRLFPSARPDARRVHRSRTGRGYDSVFQGLTSFECGTVYTAVTMSFVRQR